MNVRLSDLKLNQFGVVCHDAGGALYISKLINQIEEDINAIYVLDGPAVEIFKRELVNHKVNSISINDLEESKLRNCQLILTGSGWQTDHELRGIRLAKKMKIKSVTLLDHYVNYKRRFMRNGILVLPNTLWLTDMDAFNIASLEFKGIEIYLELIPDPIEKDMLKYLKIDSEKDVLLYITEPISNIGQLPNLNSEKIVSEAEAFQKFINQYRSLKLKLPVRLRVHPSEDKQFYIKMLAFHDFTAEISENIDPLQDIVESRYVVGMESIMLTWAIKAKKETFTIFPIDSRYCSLPHENIREFRDLIY